jgi:hypothetical protein
MEMRSRNLNFQLFLLLLLIVVTGGERCHAAFSFTSPLTRQIYQRTPFNKGSIYVLGPISGGVVTAKVRAQPISGYAGTDTGLISIPVVGTNVEGYVTLDAGWYSLEVQTFNGSGTMIDDVTLAKVGVGDVYITAGQSNFANYFSPYTAGTPNDAVNSRGLTVGLPWQSATDPQPSLDGTLSSMFPVLGNKLFATTGYPVGMVNIAVGNTSVAQWLPGTTNYTRIKTALSFFPKYGFRMFLWGQGENDAAFNTPGATYISQFQQMIYQARIDAGWEFPVGLAEETHPNELIGPQVAPAQVTLGSTFLKTFLAANADSLGNTYRYDTVHFNTTTGQDAIAQLWHDGIVAQPFTVGTVPMVIDSSNNKLCFFTSAWKCVQGL